MRVWALASCGGLLALTACSADQANGPTTSAVPSDSENATRATSRSAAATSSPIARPEVRPRQSLQGRARLSPSAPRDSSVTAQTRPQADQIRARLERLRAQHGSRLAPTTPLVTAPLPTSTTTSTPLYSSLQPPQAQADGLPSDVKNPSANPSGDTLATTSRMVSPSSPSQTSTTQLTSPRPNLAAPEVTTTAPDLATDLGPIVPASSARSYPIAPRRHQGYGGRPQRQPLVLAAPTLSAAGASRLHGDELVVQAEQPQAEPPKSAAPEQVVNVVADNSSAAVAASPTSEASAAPAAAPHRSSGDTTVTLSRSAVSLASTAGARGHQSQVIAHELAAVSPDSPTAEIISLDSTAPESVPLESVSLDAEPPATASSDSGVPGAGVPGAGVPGAGVIEDQPAPSNSLPISSAAPRGLPTDAISADRDGAAPAVPTLSVATIAPSSETTALGHRSQTDLATLQLAPQHSNSPKVKSLASCLSASDLPLTIDASAEGETSATPRFSSASEGAPRLGRIIDLEKANPAAVLCAQELSSTSAGTEAALTPD